MKSTTNRAQAKMFARKSTGGDSPVNACRGAAPEPSASTGVLDPGKFVARGLPRVPEPDRLGGRSPICIYEITAGITTYVWLCETHRKNREAAGWTVKKHGECDQSCDDCTHETQPDTSGMRFPGPQIKVDVT
jgi:hypothetical protein